MRQLVTWLTLSLFFAALPASAQQSDRIGFAPQGITPGELAERAVATHPAVLAARERVTSSQGLRHQAGFRPNPTLELDGSTARMFSREDEGERSIGVSQVIELGKKQVKRVEVAALEVQITEAAAAEAQRRVRAEILAACVGAVNSNRLLAVLNAQLQAVREFLRLTQARAREGEVPPLEADLTRVEVSRLEAQRALAQAKLDRSLAGLQRLVPRELFPLTLRDRIETGTLLVSENDLRDRARTERPDLRAARLRAQQATAEVRLARAQGTPDLVASVRYINDLSVFENVLGTGQMIRSRDNLLAFGVSIPLPFRNRNQGNIQAATAAERANRLEASAMEAEVGRDVAASHAAFQATGKASEIFRQEVVNQAERNLEVIREAYRLGQLRLLDVLNEQKKVLDLQLASIDAEGELALSAVALEAAVGRSLGLLP